jgi:hypothetical protein
MTVFPKDGGEVGFSPRTMSSAFVPRKPSFCVVLSLLKSLLTLSHTSRDGDPYENQRCVRALILRAWRTRESSV